MRGSKNPLARLPATRRARLRRAFGLLLERFEGASSSWGKACGLDELTAVGVQAGDIRWLIRKGMVEHSIEETKPGHKRRVLAKSARERFSEKSYFVLSRAGAEAARHLTAQVPFYDRERRELWARGKLIRCFTVPAPDQEMILLSFQELAWPLRIDDPLPPKHGSQSEKLRLRDAIKRLNRHQKPQVIRFRADGTGRGILWEFLE